MKRIFQSRRLVRTALVTLCMFSMTGLASADVLRTVASGDWSDSSIWWNDTTGAAAGRTPNATDTIQISGGNTVSYDLVTGTFADISVTGASTLGYKLADGLADIREMRVTGGISVGNDSYDHSKLYVGGTFGGSSIEAADNLAIGGHTPYFS